jgi:iron(III) transport system ATP-binding protein
MLGPSGCGKTTLLRAIAGLEPIASGEIRLGERILSDGRVHVPPERRKIGMVFQSWALFPHLSVAKNVGYGLPRDERTPARIDEVLDMVGLMGTGERAPHTLSGGQQQRVALARALAPRPSVLLLDEPFSNLDTTLRVEIRTEVHRLLADLDITTIFVTHDQDEAFVLGDEVAVMSAGHVVQQGTPAELYALPDTPWIARFVGEANLLGATANETSAATVLGDIPLREAAAGPVEVLLRPEDLTLVAAGAAAGAEVVLVEYYGHDTTYELRLANNAIIRARLGSAPRFAAGDHVDIRYVGGPTVSYPVG